MIQIEFNSNNHYNTVIWFNIKDYINAWVQDQLSLIFPVLLKRQSADFEALK